MYAVLIAASQGTTGRPRKRNRRLIWAITGDRRCHAESAAQNRLEYAVRGRMQVRGVGNAINAEEEDQPMDPDFSEYIAKFSRYENLETMIIRPFYAKTLCDGDDNKVEVHGVFYPFENNTAYIVSIETNQSVEELKSIVAGGPPPSDDVVQRIAEGLFYKSETEIGPLAESVRRSIVSQHADDVRAEINPQLGRRVTGDGGETYTLYRGRVEGRVKAHDLGDYSGV